MTPPIDRAAWQLVHPAEEQDWIAAALAQPVEAPIVRVWAYGTPAVVLGRAQQAQAAAWQAASAKELPLLIRPTGGGAVLAGHWMLSASVLLPPEHGLVDRSIARSFGWLGLLHADWLAALGVRTTVVEAPRAAPPELKWACFAGLSHGELTIDGAKILGLAQARKRNGVLLSSGVLLTEPPWALLAEAVGRPVAEADALADQTTHAARWTGRTLALPEMAQSLLEALRREPALGL